MAVRQLAGAPLSRSSFGDALQLLELCRAQSLPTQHRTSACFDRSFIQAHPYAHAQLNGWMILVTDGARNPTRCGGRHPRRPGPRRLHVMVVGSSVLAECNEDRGPQLDEWDDTVTRHRAEGGRPNRRVGLGDFASMREWRTCRRPAYHCRCRRCLRNAAQEKERHRIRVRGRSANPGRRVMSLSRAGVMAASIGRSASTHARARASRREIRYSDAASRRSPSMSRNAARP